MDAVFMQLQARVLKQPVASGFPARWWVNRWVDVPLVRLEQDQRHIHPEPPAPHRRTAGCRRPL